MPTLTIALPIPPGRAEAWRRLCQEIQENHRAAHDASRRQMGITHERLALLESPFGWALLVTWEATDAGRAISRMATSTIPFDCWFRAKIEALQGLPLLRGHPPEKADTIFVWHASEAE